MDNCAGEGINVLLIESQYHFVHLFLIIFMWTHQPSGPYPRPPSTYLGARLIRPSTGPHTPGLEPVSNLTFRYSPAPSLHTHNLAPGDQPGGGRSPRIPPSQCLFILCFFNIFLAFFPFLTQEYS